MHKVDTKGCVIHTSIINQDTLGVRPMYISPTCMGSTPYVSWYRIDVG